MAQIAPVPVVTSAPAVPVSTAPIPEGLIWTALAGAASWAAAQTAMRKDASTLGKIAGWSGAVAAGLVALTGLTGILAPTAARGLPVRWYWTA